MKKLTTVIRVLRGFKRFLFGNEADCWSADLQLPYQHAKPERVHTLHPPILRCRAVRGREKVDAAVTCPATRRLLPLRLHLRRRVHSAVTPLLVSKRKSFEPGWR